MGDPLEELVDIETTTEKIGATGLLEAAVPLGWSLSEDGPWTLRHIVAPLALGLTFPEAATSAVVTQPLARRVVNELAAELDGTSKGALSAR